MERKLFNEGWLFHKGGGTSLESIMNPQLEPREVTLPHDAMIAEHREPENATGNATGYYPYRTVHYTKDFELQELSCAYYLKFEGVYKNTAVYVNGCLAAQHINGYTPFIVNITAYLKKGKNSMKVLVRNGVPTSRWYTGTGIYRDVWLYQGGGLYIVPDGVKISTLEADSEVAVLSIKTTIANRENIVREICLRQKISGVEVNAPVTILPGETKVVTLRMELHEPKLWSAEIPYLYDCETELVGFDKEYTRFGIRTLSLDAKRGLRINGECIKLKGGCIHHDHGIVGAIEHQALTLRRIRKLKEAGYNAIRCAHFPASSTVLDACDELGMLVMLELCDAWTQPKIDFDYSADFACHWKEDTESMVSLAFNHPSVIFYSIGNEIGEVSDPHEVQYGRKICDTIRALDPSRYITNCINIALALMDRIPELAVKAGADINSIMNGDQGELVRLMASKEIGEPLEEAFSYLDVAGYNYASYRYESDVNQYSQRIIVGAECYPGALYENWSLCEKLSQVIGDFGWAAWDYLGEAGVGQHRYGEATDYDLYGAYPWRTAGCGDFDLIGDRRPISYWREIVWGHRAAPYISVQDPAHFGQKQSPTRWGWSDAERSWNFRGFEGKPIVVEVYSGAEEVELLCNGKSFGRQKPVQCRAFFETVYEPGELTAVNYKNGAESGRNRLITATYDIHIETNNCGNGITEIRLVDENGTLNPDARLTLKAAVEGDMEILGFGTADPKNEENYFDRSIKTYRGKALIVTRGDGVLRIEGE